MGRPLQRPRSMVSGGNTGLPDIDFDQDGFGFVYDKDQIPHFVRLDRYGGRVTDPVPVDVYGGPSSPRVLGAPWGYGVVYDVSSQNNWYYREISLDGTLVGDPQLIDPPYRGIQKNPSLQWAGTEIVMAITVSLFQLRLARLDQHGVRLTDDLVLRESNNTIGVPQLAWNGVEPAIVWPDETVTYGSPQVMFTKVECCESTDPPGPVTGLSYSDPFTLNWSDSGAERYDRLRGDLITLLGQGGDWSGTVEQCEGDIFSTTTSDTATPLLGSAYYQLVRGDDFCGPGTYSGGGAGELTGRDNDLAAICP